MSLPAILLPLAEADVVEIFGDLEFMRAGVGKRFLSRLREVLERIEGMPEMYGSIWQDVRAVRIRKFRYIVYYVVMVDHIAVLAVLYSSRDESAWQSRSQGERISPFATFRTEFPIEPGIFCKSTGAH